MNLDSINLDGMNGSTPTEQNEANSFTSEEHNFTLRESVELAMKNYFTQLDNEQPRDLYELVLAEVEAPLMEAVMSYTQGNQTKASQVLGLNRGTLRKKLKTHGLN
ncbi:MAG: DNA-binding transcriptional regulator Fis [Kangiellaceae bacterium]|nr:DNA-binding transcriptional regulator Fis [Kangiellaceae bacterium]